MEVDTVHPWRQVYFTLQFLVIIYQIVSKTFYRDCLTTWPSINQDTEQISFGTDVLKEVLWNNQYLRIDGKPVFCKKLFDKGIVYISDILSVNGKLLPWNYFRAKGLNFNDYMLLIRLSKALPDSWRNLLNNLVVNNSATNSIKERQRDLELSLQLTNETVNVSLLTYQKVYWHLVAPARVSPSALHVYDGLYPNHEINWNLVNLIPYKVTVDVKTRCFQFKLLHRVVYTNKLMHKINFSDTDLCTFCDETVESLEHLFFRCKHCQNFWKSFVLWLNKLGFGIDTLIEVDIMLGYTTCNTRH